MAARWQYERKIFRQFGPKLDAVDVRCAWEDPESPALPADPHPDLNEPLAATLADVGLPPADPFSVSDADLAAIPAPLSARFSDFLAERVLEFILERWGDPNTTKGTENRDDLGALFGMIQEQLVAKRAYNREVHGPPAAAATESTSGRMRRGSFRLGC